MKIFSVAVVLLLVLLLSGPSELKAEDFNSTYTHFLLSNAQNVKLELEKRRTFARAITFELQLEKFQRNLNQMLLLDSLSGITDGLPMVSASGTVEDYNKAKANIFKVDDLFSKNFRKFKKDKNKRDKKENNSKEKSDWLEEAETLCHESIRLFSRTANLVDDYQLVAIAFMYLAAIQKLSDDESYEFFLKSALHLNPKIKLPKLLRGILKGDYARQRRNLKKGSATFELKILPEQRDYKVLVNGKKEKFPFIKNKIGEGYYFVHVESEGMKTFDVAVPVFGGGKRLSIVLAAEDSEMESRVTAVQLEMQENEQDEGFTNFFARLDVFAPKELQNQDIETLYMLMMVGLQLKTWNINGFTISGHGGFSGFIIQEKEHNYGDFETQLSFWNLMLGIEMGYEFYIRLGADVSMNILSFHGDNSDKDTIFDFDQANLYLQSPILGSFASLKYDIGSNKPRDIHLGYSHSFRKYNLGVLSASYSGRFDYDVTGLYVKNDGLDVRKIEGDHSGMVLWERIRPGGGIFEFGMGLSLGSVEDISRFAFLEAGAMIRNKYLIFLRGSNSWSRLEKERYWGGAIGAELPVLRDQIFLRGHVGYRDYETVDRYGDPASIIFSFLVNIAH